MNCNKLFVCVLTLLGYGLSSYSQAEPPPTLQEVTEAGNLTDKSIVIWNKEGLNIGVDASKNYTVATHFLRPSPDDPRTLRFDCTSNTATGGWEFYNTALNKSVMFIKQTSGFVGIGTTDPKARLSVNGDVYARRVRVTPDEWADYVFESSYKLPSLLELEQYVQEHKHLPEILSEKEVIDQGLDVGHSQATLLKKVEEITLYLIEHHKTLAAQKEALKQQASVLADQEARLRELEAKIENK